MNRIILCSLLLLPFFILKAQEKARHSLIPEAMFEAEALNIIAEKCHVFPDSMQFAFAMIHGDSVSFYGIQQLQGSLQKINNQQSVFGIGSISKVFTSTLLTQAVAENKLKLMDPIDQYLPYSLRKDQQIPFKYLSNHTSGLPRLSPELMRMAIFNLDNPYAGYDRDKLKSYLEKKLKLKALPGEVYEYSNMGAGILGYMMEQIYDQSYETLIQEKICDRLDLKQTSTDLRALSNPFIIGRNAKGEQASTWEFDALKGAGAIFSTVEDLSKFGQAQWDSTYVAWKLMQEPTFTVSEHMSVGLGWIILNPGTDEEWLFHNGATGGYSSCMILDLKKQQGMIILSNVGAFHEKAANIDALCIDLIRWSQQNRGASKQD